MAIWDPIGHGGINPLGNVAGYAKGDLSLKEDLGGFGNKFLNPVNEFHAGYVQPPADLQNTLRQWALTGQGPSAAQAMLNRERANQVALAQGSAKSQPGLGVSGQQRLASMGQSAALANTSAQAAELRAKEQQAALEGYQNLYKTQAEAYADAMRANAEVEAQNAATRGNFLGSALKGIGGLVGL